MIARIYWIFNFIKTFVFRTKRQFLFAKRLLIEKECILKAGKKTRVFGSISCYRKAAIKLGNGVVLHKDSRLDSDGGTIIIGNDCQIGKNVIINAPKNNTIKIGERTTFYGNVQISGTVSIGEDVLFANNINVLSSTHCIDGKEKIRELDAKYLKLNGTPPSDPIFIGDDCWIGLNAVLLPGVKLGNGCVVAAGAVVKGVFEEYSIIGGVPAKKIGQR
jgi:acetyltransferase-like isoleucine patch superfamily enzyme